MSVSPHLSDDLLKKLINDDPPDTQAHDVETHIDACDECRTRLETLAAGENWLAPYRSSLSSEYHAVVGERQNTVERSEHPASPRDFDRQAIDSMLTDLLAPPIHPENIGQLGNYEVESVIGYGGMGVVLRAYDRNLQRPTAIKLIVPRLANDGTAKQRFAREARATATVLHPNVIAIHCIDETSGVPWFVMPLIPGPTLRELVEQNGPLREQDIVRIGLQIASGLAAAHSHGVVHRDIKPDNILVDNSVNRVVITDFGLARHDTDTMITRTGVLAGTLHYMSPEQIRGEDLDGRSDLFSLGALLYFLATGSTPFDANSPVGVLHKIANDAHHDVRRLNPGISKTLAQAIDLLLAKERPERFQSAAKVEEFFEGLISHINQPTQNALPLVPTRERLHGRSWLLWLAPVALLAVGAVGWWFLNRPQPESSPAAFWDKIQQEHALESRDEFLSEFDSFVSSADRLNQELSDGMPQVESQMNEALRAMDADLKTVFEGLDLE